VWLPTFLLLGTALAADLGPQLATAHQAIDEGKAGPALRILDEAEAAAETGDILVPASVLARIWVYRGMAGRIAGIDDDQVLGLWRQALVLDLSVPFDEELWPGDDGILFEALRREVRDRPRVDAQVPELTGAAQLFVDGRRVGSGDQVLEGRHLAQIRCPDDAVYGTWTDFSRKLKWLKLCPGRVDTSVVVEEQSLDPFDEFLAFGSDRSDAPAPASPTASISSAPAATSSNRTSLTLLTPTSDPVEPGTHAVEVAEALAVAETAFADMDLEGFQRARTKAGHALHTLDEPLSPVQAATYHRVAGLQAYLFRNPDRSRSALRAAWILDPTTSLSTQVAPPGNPLHSLWVEATQGGDNGMRAMSPPTDAILYIDGTPSVERPRARPTVLQVASADGTVAGSWYLEGDQDDPPWPELRTVEAVVWEEPSPAPAPTKPTKPTKPTLPEPKATAGGGKGRVGGVVLLAGGCSAVLGSGLLYAVALKQKGVYMDPASGDFDDRSELAAQRQRVNRTATTAVGLGVAGVGLGVAGVISLEF